ncbi:hypothetical protein HG361_004313 [Escherichia coli]|nr:hypothetical protein [Escherichia coli]
MAVASPVVDFSLQLPEVTLLHRLQGIRDTMKFMLRIYSNEQQVASHRLCSAASSWQTVPEHHAPLWQQVSQVEHRPLSTYS